MIRTNKAQVIFSNLLMFKIPVVLVAGLTIMVFEFAVVDTGMPLSAVCPLNCSWEAPAGTVTNKLTILP